MPVFSNLKRSSTMSRSQAPPDAAPKPCRRCGKSWPDAMTRCGLCYECVLIEQGRKPVERHHPLGRDNPIVAGISVEVPGNWHRALDARRARRPEILKRPGDDPLHQIAAAVATFGEAADVVADVARREAWPEWIAGLAEIFANAAGSAADWLLVLADTLDEWLGPTWIEEMPKWRP
jgi:hypothetical protein